jgi:hypothetical protein
MEANSIVRKYLHGLAQNVGISQGSSYLRAYKALFPFPFLSAIFPF